MVALQDGRIIAVGRAEEVRSDFPGLREIQLGDAVLMPGLVDCHCHLEWSLTGGLIGPGPFDQWIGRMLRLAGRYRRGDHLVAARYGALLAVQAGTTTLADSGPTGAGVQALTEMGLRGIVFPEIFGREVGDGACASAARMGERLAVIEESAGELVRVGLSPHAPYSVGPELWMALADEPSTGPPRLWSTHLAESPSERAAIEDATGGLAEQFAALGIAPGRWPGGEGTVSRLARHRALDAVSIAAHCVQVDETEARLLAAASVTVAHCPISNERLQCGTAPLALLEAAGVCIALGTDSPASAGPYDLRAEARAARSAHTAAREPVPTAEALVAMMTRCGATALGLEDEVGALVPGMAGDLLALTPGSDGWKSDDPFERVLDDDARPALVMCSGKVLQDQNGVGRFDRDAIAAAAAEAHQALC
jgi:cytosine/adenosine deaminase-related metal-dependent hydrolase